MRKIISSLLFLSLCIHLYFLAIRSAVYTPDELAGNFRIPLLNGDYVDRSSWPLPLIIWVTNFQHDPWSATSLLANDSILYFLQSPYNQGSVHYLFIAWTDQADIIRLQSSIQQQAAHLSLNQQQSNSSSMQPALMLDHILFASQHLSALSNQAQYLQDVLTSNSWSTIIDRISITILLNNNDNYSSSSTLIYNVTRLDCYWPYCLDPDNNRQQQPPYRLLYAGDFCHAVDSPAGNVTATLPSIISNSSIPVYFLLSTTSHCDYDLAVVRALVYYTNNSNNYNNIAGILIAMSEPKELLSQINREGMYYEELATIRVAAISYEDGQTLLSHFAATTGTSEEMTVTIQFYGQVHPGYTLIIDNHAHLQSMGSIASPASMMLASWAGQYEYYRSVQVDQTLTNWTASGRNSVHIPLLEEAVIGAVSVIVPIQTVQRLYQANHRYHRIYLETSITCPGLSDSDCSRWDHVVTIALSCSTSPINAPGRRKGNSRARPNDDDSDGYSSRMYVTAYSNSSTFFDPLQARLYQKKMKNRQRRIRQHPDDLHPSQQQQYEKQSEQHKQQQFLNNKQLREVGGSSYEIARYITAFHRRNGHWLTDVTPLVRALLYDFELGDGVDGCEPGHGLQVDASVGGETWILSSKLWFVDDDDEFEEATADDGVQPAGIVDETKVVDKQIVVDKDEIGKETVTTVRINTRLHRQPLYSIYETLNTAFNQYTNRHGLPLTLLRPSLLHSGNSSSSSTAVYKVLLHVYLTTHGMDTYGCCEFLPTRHTFTIHQQRYDNNNNSSLFTSTSYNVSFGEAGSEWGCANQALYGSVPNEYGTWWYGRGGWCDGMPVMPIILDVTAAFYNSNSNNSIDYSSEIEYSIDYSAYVYDLLAEEYQLPKVDQAGYVIMSASIIYYYYNTIDTALDQQDVCNCSASTTTCNNSDNNSNTSLLLGTAASSSSVLDSRYSPTAREQFLITAILCLTTICLLLLVMIAYIFYSFSQRAYHDDNEDATLSSSVSTHSTAPVLDGHGRSSKVVKITKMKKRYNAIPTESLSEHGRSNSRGSHDENDVNDGNAVAGYERRKGSLLDGRSGHDSNRSLLHPDDPGPRHSHEIELMEQGG